MTRTRSRSRCSSPLLVCLFGLLSLLASSAWAQPEEPKEKAKAYSERAISLFEQEDFQGAQTLYQKAYSLWKNPIFLYNSALCHRRLKNTKEEQEALCQYLFDFPDEESLVEFPQAPPRAKIDTRLKKIVPEGDLCPPRASLPATQPSFPVSAPASLGASLPQTLTSTAPSSTAPALRVLPPVTPLPAPSLLRSFQVPVILIGAGSLFGVGALAFKAVTERDNETNDEDYRKGLALALASDLSFLGAGLFFPRSLKQFQSSLLPTKPLSVEGAP